MSVLCSISTRGRYETTLPLALQSVCVQTRLPDKLVVFDDNDDPQDLRSHPLYGYLFKILDAKGVPWEWVYAERRGQHFNHERANRAGYTWVWRLDDDTVAEPDTLERLLSHVGDKVGAVGGAILTPPVVPLAPATGRLADLDREPNLQWSYVTDVREVDHLHCSFLYRAGLTSYDLGLSRVAHREETLFTYKLRLLGYQLLVVPAVTWHLRAPAGGIRTGTQELFEHDEARFREQLDLLERPVVVLDCGLGDHVVARRALAELLPSATVFSCYPGVIPGRSIAEAERLFCNLDRFNIYRWMESQGWNRSLEAAFRKFYSGAPHLALQ